MDRLLKIGFIKIGYWELQDDQLHYVMTESFTDGCNNLYAFVCDGEVKYIGKTTRLLKKRMYHYKRPGATQSTNIKNNANIRDALLQSMGVDILVLPDNGLMHYGQFHLNLAAGLEDSMIKIINPEWNGSTRITGGDNILSTKSIIDDESEILSDEVSEEMVILESKDYTFNMAPTYWKRGFFNVSVASSEEFSYDGDKLTIVNHDGSVILTAIINRTANRTKAPRIMGGTGLRNFFQENYKVDDVVSYRMLSMNTMQLY
ncbi:GIY-YIG nuclease family protein [Rouxiella sp. T17]|uniref:GIY-YIG nuclease family protein n=1 Tax=Rouxiella sp. T17 TaxID=3085684 RepID=UPI002FC7069D